MNKSSKLFLTLLVISAIFDVVFLFNKEINTINLSNSFFFTSIIFLSIGFYSFVLKKGAFSGFTHSLRRIKHLMFRPSNTYEGPKTYYEQYMLDIDKRKEYTFYRQLIVVGLINFLVSIIFTYII